MGVAETCCCLFMRDDSDLSEWWITNDVGKEDHLGCSDKFELKFLSVKISFAHDQINDASTRSL